MTPEHVTPEQQAAALADVRRRHGRRRQRRIGAVAGVAAALTLLFGVVVAAQPREHDRSLVATAPSTEPTTTTEEPTTSTTAEPVTTTTPAEPATTTSTTQPPAVGRGADRDLKITVTATPGTIAAGGLVDVSVVVEGVRVEQVGTVAVAFGDGRGDDFGAISCPAGPSEEGGSTTTRPDPSRPPAKTVNQQRRHAYRAAGTYAIKVTAFSGYYCTVRASWARYAEATVNVRVTAGTAASNGPEQPTIGTVMQQGTLTKGVSRFSVNADDPDGWVALTTIDWGDGSEPTTAGAGSGPCTETKERWPSGGAFGTFEHRYATSARSRHLTITIVSTGCHGEDHQTATKVVEVSTTEFGP